MITHERARDAEAVAIEREAAKPTEMQVAVGLREWFGAERYARDWEYIDHNFKEQMRGILTTVLREAPLPPPSPAPGWNSDMVAAPHGPEVCCLAPEYAGPVMLRRLADGKWRDWDGDIYNPTAWLALPPKPDCGGAL